MKYLVILTPQKKAPVTVDFTEKYNDFFLRLKDFENKSDIHPQLIKATLEKDRIEMLFEADSAINIGHITHYFSKPLYYDAQWGLAEETHAVFSMAVFELNQLT